MYKEILKDIQPKTVYDIVFGNTNSEAMIKNIANGVVPFPTSGRNGILLYGMPGTGKSDLAKMLPDLIEKTHGGESAAQQNFSLTAGENGSSLIKKIRSSSQFIPVASHHYFVLDEVDNLKGDAMYELKALMNTPRTIFLMTTNYISEIEVAVKDRCRLVEMNAAKPEQWLPLCRRILSGLDVYDIPATSIVKQLQHCDGSARDVIDQMFQLAAAYKAK